MFPVLDEKILNLLVTNARGRRGLEVFDLFFDAGVSDALSAYCDDGF